MEASQAEKNVFGTDARLHPVTGMALESGRGCLSDEQQADIHCNFIEGHHGKSVEADTMRPASSPIPERSS